MYVASLGFLFLSLVFSFSGGGLPSTFEPALFHAQPSVVPAMRLKRRRMKSLFLLLDALLTGLFIIEYQRRPRRAPGQLVSGCLRSGVQ